MPRRKVSSDISRLKQGRGQGHGRDYKPFLTVRDVPSRGLSHRPKGHKTKRVHQLLSNLEEKYFFILDWSSLVIDIREQYPLDLDETLKIADRLGIVHNLDLKTREPKIVTTDFLVDANDGKKRVQIARALKYVSELNDNRVIEKLEIERTYWSERNVNWGIVTEADIPEAIVTNLKLLYMDDESDFQNITRSVISQVRDALIRFAAKNNFQSLSNTALEVDHRLGLETGTSLWVTKHLIATRQWRVDMRKPLAMDKPLCLVRSVNTQED